MQRHTETKVLPYRPDDLFRLVGDVDHYPEFVPWVSAMRTWNSVAPEPGVTQVDAEAEVRFAIVRERFATRVRRDANKRQIDVNLLYGPFRSLHNRWRFEDHPCGAKVEFLIEFADRFTESDGHAQHPAQRRDQHMLIERPQREQADRDHDPERERDAFSHRPSR